MSGFSSAWNRIARNHADEIRRIQGLFESNLTKSQIAEQARDAFSRMRREFWQYVGTSNDLSAKQIRDRLSYAGFRISTDGTVPTAIIVTPMHTRI